MQSKQTVLVVDDDSTHLTMLKTLIQGWGYRVKEAADGEGAIEMVREEPFDLILMDIRMIKVSGLEALRGIKAYNPAIPIILMTAYSSVESAKEALKGGAYDYLTKPLDFDELRLTMQRAMEHSALKEENRQLRAQLGDGLNRQNIIGNSRAMLDLLETVSQVAPTEATVLIAGESGTGKELIAGLIHEHSSRRKAPFVKMNCAAISESLLESELFGHEKGSFTGADRRHEGKFRQADRGTLFLDEVSEMSGVMQAKLLRVLQEKEVTRVGGKQSIKVDVRVLAATNKDLKQQIRRGRFREDLYYRLNVVVLNVPPLRDRREDIPLLGQHFCKIFAAKNSKQIQGFTPRAMDLLMKYDWPGNVRELMNAVERAVVLSRSEYLQTEDLPLLGREEHVPDPDRSFETYAERTLQDLEKEAVLRTLEAVGQNKSEAARRLGITRKTLHKKLKSYGLM